MPRDRYHKDFEPCMQAISFTISFSGERSEGRAMAEHLLDVGLIPSLLEVLLDPPSSTSHQLDIGAQPASPGAPTTAHSPAGCSTELASLCTIVDQLVDVMHFVARSLAPGKQAGQGGGDLVMAMVEQLLSSPAALLAAIRRALSAEAQEAAKAGRDTLAAKCMASVSGMFRLAAFLLQSADCNSSERVGSASRSLAEFLHRKENLPHLEALCLPLNPASKCSSWSPAPCLCSTSA
jgi:hypothetical protein